MKKGMKWVAGALLGAILLLLGFLGYMGLLTPPEVKAREMGPFTYVYEEFQGDYAKTGPVFGRVHKAMESEGIVATREIGIYFDDPDRVPAEQLHSHCGVLLEGLTEEKLDELAIRYKIGSIQTSRFAVVEFPLRNSLSYILGPARGYAALMKYFQEKKIPYTVPFELYDTKEGIIDYVMPIPE